jgi:hypothetical protein
MYDKHFIVTDDSGTAYRLKPNPDGERNTGFREGAVLEWTDDGKEWKDYFFIGPGALAGLSAAMVEAAKEVE